MITAYASLETAVAATKCGAFDFLAKPFTPEELKAAVYKAAKHLLLHRQARQLAQEKRQLRFQFISTLGHELKAPLAAVEQYLHLLGDTFKDEGNSREKQMIERSLARLQGMRKLISDLLDLTRLESGQKKRELAIVDLIEVAHAVLDTVSLEASSRAITVELHACAPLVMTADRWEIETVLNNLVSNAVKYNHDAGRVDVTIAAEAGFIIIRVADTGIGIAEKDQARGFTVDY
jgi:signal transduction histidine kinase